MMEYQKCKNIRHCLYRWWDLCDNFNGWNSVSMLKPNSAEVTFLQAFLKRIAYNKHKQIYIAIHKTKQWMINQKYLEMCLYILKPAVQFEIRLCSPFILLPKQPRTSNFRPKPESILNVIYKLIDVIYTSI